MLGEGDRETDEQKQGTDEELRQERIEKVLGREMEKLTPEKRRQKETKDRGKEEERCEGGGTATEGRPVSQAVSHSSRYFKGEQLLLLLPLPPVFLSSHQEVEATAAPRRDPVYLKRLLMNR